MPAPENHVDAFLASLLLVAIAEIGDKTQLLSFILAARFKKQAWPIIIGIFVATVANHLMAAFVGDWVASKVDPTVMRWILGGAFLAFAAWALIPDTLDEEPKAPRFGAFITTLVLFFLAEMGDKTQLATIALGANYTNLFAVTLGTTFGMMIANVPAVLLGAKLAERFPLQKMRFVAAVLFAIFGLLILLPIEIPWI